MEISKQGIEAAYMVSKQVYERKIKRKDGLNQLAPQHMSESSASGYIATFRAMVEGRLYQFTINDPAADYYLSRIQIDYGEGGLRKALTSLTAHIEYYNTHGKGTRRTLPKIHAKYAALLSDLDFIGYPGEISEDKDFLEGAVTRIYVNVYERNTSARAKCIEHFGCNCHVCCFNFEKAYGDIGKSFIHVHHLVDISSIGKEYIVDPINDLRPVCPNCHAMLHQKTPAFMIEDLKQRLKANFI